MREYFIDEHLHKILVKLFKKDRHRYTILMKKMEEILISVDVEHYKNLHKPLQHLKSVHINTHFVLVFKYDKKRDVVLFYDFDHHDSIYTKNKD
ncbi:MAG: addiction module toxin RelE [Euryarchaeota archaeon]|nr:addiction module toxin RelE [Euryarchaeota archaeon]